MNRGPRQIYRFWVVLIVVLGLACPRMRAVSWFPFGPDGGDARAFAADPHDHAHLYLGTAIGWIYESHDGGRKWQRLARVGDRDDLIIDHILVDPADPKHLVVGAYVLADGGIYVSNDGGATWSSPPEMHGQSVRSLTLAPTDPKIIVAGTLDGIFRSTDNGAHWRQISEKGSKEIHEVQSLAIDPADPDTIYAGTWHLPWKTTDAGKSWRSIKQGIIEDSDVFSIIVDPKQPKVVYASACSGIYKSDDGGAKFVKAPGIPSSARRTRVLTQDPNHPDTVYAGTTEGLYRTDDAGKLWTQTTSADLIVNDVYVDPANSQHVLLATDRQGVLSSDDGGVSFVPSNGGFSARHIVAYTGDAQHAATVYVGVVNDKEWGGVFVSHTGGLSWSQLSAGLDGHDVFSLGQAPDGTILAGTQHGIYRLKDGLWERVGGEVKAAEVAGGAPVAGAAATVGSTPAAAEPVPVLRTKASAARARQRALVQPRKVAPAIAVKNFDGSVYGFARAGETLFAATSGGVLRSPSSGVSWTTVPAVPADEWRFVAAANANVAVASLDALEVSADGGTTWKAVALPAQLEQVSALAVDGRGGVWVAGREGVFVMSSTNRVSTNGATGWEMLKDPYVRNINSLYYDERADRMLVTSNEPATKVFAVSVPSLQVKTIDTGWNLRFVRPMSDYMLGVTLFDGIVVQPRMVDSAEVEHGKQAPTGAAEVAQH